MRVVEHLIKTLRDSAIFNPEVQVAPSCILWPDKDRQWEAVIPRLQSELGELLVLGDYAPENRVGPANLVALRDRGQGSGCHSTGRPGAGVLPAWGESPEFAGD